MAYSSAKTINDIASNYVRNVGDGKGELKWSNAGLVADLETAAYNNAWSANQAQIQRDFEKDMSNTAHQREVADLQAAGLNPVLSANSTGASTPSVGIASTDTGATGSGSKTADNALNAIISQNNALVSANAQMAAASMAASATRYAADASASASMYAADAAAAASIKNNENTTNNPNNVWGLLRAIVTGATGSSSAKDLGSKSASKTSTSVSTPKGSAKVSIVSGKYSYKTKAFDVSDKSMSIVNKALKTNIGHHGKNIYYNDFKDYNTYLMFCAYIGCSAVTENDFKNYRNMANKGTKWNIFYR